MDPKAKDDKFIDFLINSNDNKDVKSDCTKFESVTLRLNNEVGGLLIFSATISKGFEELVTNGELSNEFDQIFGELDKSALKKYASRFIQ